jgi:hypothetical protein
VAPQLPSPRIMVRKAARGAPCPCGSGRAFKDCHGRASRVDRRAAGVAVVVLLVGGLILGVLLRSPHTSSPEIRRPIAYSSIPGLALGDLGPRDRALLVNHLNHTGCPCDCDFTVAECRHRHGTCEHSLQLAERLLGGLSRSSPPDPEGTSE